jgi:hypothetical protein
MEGGVVPVVNGFLQPVAIEDHLGGRLVRYSDGSVTRDVDQTYTEDDYRMMYQGYACCRCGKVQETAFPESCGFPYCDGYPDGFPMRERQRQVMDEEYDGEKWIGLTRETYERLLAADELRVTKGGVVIPRGIKP